MQWPPHYETQNGGMGMSDNLPNDNNIEEEIELDTVTLTLEDDSELECAVIAIFPAGDRMYAALVPLSENDELDEEADVLIFRFIDNGDDKDPDLENIESDEEYEMACDAFDELLDEADFEEIEEGPEKGITVENTDDKDIKKLGW
jgi:uncharacterized protein YrzB (UPF0473 family)